MSERELFKAPSVNITVTDLDAASIERWREVLKLECDRPGCITNYSQGIDALCNLAARALSACPEIEVVRDAYYLQDKRSWVGNDMVFWAKDGNGYTTDLRKAHVYTRAEAEAQQRQRDTDIPWPKAYVDSKSRHAVDMQYVSHADAALSLPLPPAPDAK